MLVLLILTSIIIGTLLYVFIAPFYLEIDNTREIYRLRFHKIAYANLRFTERTLLLDLKILWYSRQIDLFEEGKKPKARRKTARQKKKTPTRIPWEKIKSVLKSFKVSHCRVSIDTGDVQVNGMLFPVLYMVKFYSGREISINFVNETIIQLQLQNRLSRICWAFLKG